jgi:hypothetical protein
VNIFEGKKIETVEIVYVLQKLPFSFLACRDDCPESYCHDSGVGVTPQGKNFNLGYIFRTIRDRILIFHI